MVAYRLYCFDGVGSIQLADSIEAADDGDAVAQARDLKRDALKCEVWCGSRLVATLNASDLRMRSRG